GTSLSQGMGRQHEHLRLRQGLRPQGEGRGAPRLAQERRADLAGPLRPRVAPIATMVPNRPREIANRPVTGATQPTRLTRAPRSQSSALRRGLSPDLISDFWG